MQGKPNNICEVCKGIVSWKQNKIRLLSEEVQSDITNLIRKGKVKTINLKIWHTTCYLGESKNERSENEKI